MPRPRHGSSRYDGLLGVLALAAGILLGHSAEAQQGDSERGRALAATCAACHGVDGNSVTPEWPSLAGQHPSYTVRQLQAFQTGLRHEVTMTPFALDLSEQDMHDLAAFYAGQTRAPQGADPQLIPMGERIYRGGIPERGVAACIACHGPRGQGNPMAAYPAVAGQHATYALRALREYAAGERRSDVHVQAMMRDIAAALREDEMRALASYMQGLH
jgi:cytochrome c553